MATTSTVDSNQQPVAEQIAHDYLRTAKRWSEEDYHLDILREEGGRNSPVVVLDAVHHDDLRPQGRAAPKSLQLYIDLNNRRVLKELGYQ
jgi:hypothetical protein